MNDITPTGTIQTGGFFMASTEQDMLIEGVLCAMQYGPFLRTAVIDNASKNPGLGHTIQYGSNEHGQATVYIYDKHFGIIPNGASSDIVIEEFNNATNDVLVHCKALHDCKIESLDRFTLGPQDNPNVACAVFSIMTQSTRRLSFLFISGCSNKFVKIRTTLNTNAPADMTAYNFAGMFFMEHFKLHSQSQHSSH